MLPGGVNSPVRAMRSIGRDPIFIDRAAGAEIIDVDGNNYVDYVCSWGPLIHGHAHPRCSRRSPRRPRSGRPSAPPTAGEVELAELVCARMPAVDMLRMTSSGTEASMSAIRVARAATGREKLLKFAGAYHGHVDGLLAEAGSGLATQGIPSSPGRARGGHGRDRRRALERPGRRPRRVRRARVRRGAVPSPTRPTWASSRRAAGFLELLRELATEHGALLVFDEVITGFRVSHGGAQELTGVLPDLTVMGKVIGGGLPAAAYGGSTELMELRRAGRRRLPGRHAEREPARGRRRPRRRCSCSTRRPTCSCRTSRCSSPTGLREAAGERPVQVAHTTGPA